MLASPAKTDHDPDDDRGVVFNIQRFSIHDGPGIRTTVFLKGCPLHCAWCANPESMRSHAEIITRDLSCLRCGQCARACPRQAILVTQSGRTIQWRECDHCLRCAEVCPSGAIEPVGKTMGAAEVLDTVVRDSGYYRRSKGGMTLSGGEPLVQWRFALLLLRGARSRGLHTALDTSGHADWRVMRPLLEQTNLVLYDLKHMDSAKHEKFTGVPNDRILDNLQRTLTEAGVRVWIRHPVIPDFNDTEEECEELFRFVRSLGPSVEKISLLPYHKFAETKYRAMGREYPLQGAPLIRDERMDEFREQGERHGLRVELGR